MGRSFGVPASSASFLALAALSAARQLMPKRSRRHGACARGLALDSLPFSFLWRIWPLGAGVWARRMCAMRRRRDWGLSSKA
uniref:Secreted protein n=1 Tax=Ixodes scapularis TaxID=6945 RepID=A0A4D5RCT7_IXOSC